ncbi:MAG: Zn-ribbon domain-containing OB-fold protein [Candidatus Heimdallarchaeota archaeon]|nr:Zn-ribbon domain-containing OB-fold protein [Candidatus Heimdallarchaeota archaeon]
MTRKLVSENWRLEGARYNLVGSHCTSCDTYHFPKKMVCLKCKNSDSLQDYTFENKGTLVEWTQIFEAAKGFENRAPYYFGIVELKEGIRISCQLTSVFDEKQLEPGSKVSMVFRKLFEDGDEGLVTYGFKAVPALLKE